MSGSEEDMHRLVAGATVAQLREQKGWTQGQLAEKLGVAQATISRIEHGLLAPDMAQLRLLADAFGMKAPELMQLFEDAHARALAQADAASNGPSGEGGWKKVLAVAGAVGVAGLAGFAAALALKDRQDRQPEPDEAPETPGRTSRRK